MAEYIEREALLKDIEDERPENWTNSEAERQAESDFYKYKDIVKIQPTADVVEVVRCKDCEYGKGNDYEGNIKVPFAYHCTYDDLSYNGAEHFCSYGKRKEGVDNG